MTPTELAIKFHDTYERLAPMFGYITRKDTRKFDALSQNGALMVEVCAEILREVAEEAQHPEQWVSKLQQLPASDDVKRQHGCCSICLKNAWSEPDPVTKVERCLVGDLRQQLDDYENATKHAMAQHPDAQHCACAPLLAAKCALLQKQLDAANEDAERLSIAARMFEDAGLKNRCRAFVLIGHPKDTMELAEVRLRECFMAGFLPFAMLWRDQQGNEATGEWRRFHRLWCRPAATRSLLTHKIKPTTLEEQLI